MEKAMMIVGRSLLLVVVEVWLLPKVMEGLSS